MAKNDQIIEPIEADFDDVVRASDAQTLTARYSGTLATGDVQIPCYVPEDGRRVTHQRGMVSALHMSRGGSSRGGGDRLAYFVAQ